MKRVISILLLSTGLFGLASCVAPGFDGPGGSVQGTANVEQLERESVVTPPPSDAANAANAALYGRGGSRYPGYYYGRHPGYYYGWCGDRRCYRPR